MGLRVNKLSKVLGSFTGTSPDPLLTSNATTGQVDTANNLFGSLASANIWVGSVANLPVARLISGDISIDNLGVAAIAPGVIVNADINATAAIAFSKLAVLPVSKAVVTDGAGVIATSVTSATQIGYLSTTTSDIQVQLNAKQATITGAASSVVTTNLSPNIVVISDGAGKITSSTVSTTALGYITNLISDAQTQLNSKLTVSLGATVTGDIIYYNGSAWTNLPRGTLGQTLQSTSGSIAWGTPTINGIPSGGTTHQFLAKNSSTDFDASWYTLTTSLITDIVATAAQINSLSTYLTSAGAPTGTNGQVLSISAGTMVWASVSGLGTVTSVDVSGGTTGLTTSGGPITISGTITLSGTLGTINGGTGQTAVAVGDILYGSAINTWSRLAAGTNGYVLTMSGGVPIWATGGGGGGMSIGGTITGGTPGSVLWVGAASALSQDNNNFFWNSGSRSLSVNVNGDFTGRDSINAYNEIDAYKPNSTQGSIGSGSEAGHSVSSSRGTGIVPAALLGGDLLGGFAGWGYTGGVYQALGGMWVTSQGVASTLGGQIDFYTRADGGILIKRLTIDNTGTFTLSSFVTTGVVHNNSSGLFSTSLIVAADIVTNTLTYSKLQQATALSVLGNSTNTTANLADIVGTNNQVLRVSGTTLGFGSIDLSQSATVGISRLAYLNIVQGTGLSVVGVTGNVTADLADIVGTNNQVLRVSGTTLSFGSIDLSQSATVGSSRLAYINLAQGAGLSVLGVTGNAIADNASIVAASDFQILRRSGTSIGFGSIDLSQPGAVGSSVLGVANGGTGSSTGGFWALATGGTLSGVNTISSAFPSGLIFTSTWTATGNNQNSWQLTGTLTSENVASDFWNGLVIDPTLTRNGGNPATQTATALLINPTFVNNPTNQYILRAQSAGTDRFRIASNGDVTIVPFSIAGIVHNNSSGVLSSSLIVSSDVTTNTFWNIGGNTLTGNAIFGDISAGGFTINIQTKGITRQSIDSSGNQSFTQSAQSSAWGKAILFTPGAHTSLTAATEFIDYDFALNRTVQWLAGTVPVQRQIYMRGVTLAGASATAVFTVAYTLFIDPPTLGPNASSTSLYALGVNGNQRWLGGTVNFNQTVSFVADAQSQGIVFQAGTAVAAGQFRFDMNGAFNTPNVSYNFVTLFPSSSGHGLTNSSGTQSIGLFVMQPLINVTSAGTTTLRAIDYAPTETSLTNVVHYFLTNRSTTALTGLGTATPTAMLHVVGATKLDGNLTLVSAGNGIYIKQGTNATCGRGTLVGGTVTINTTKVTSTCEIFITDRGVVTTNLGSIYEDSGSRVNGTSFTVKSTNVLDTSSFCWLIIEAP